MSEIRCQSFAQTVLAIADCLSRRLDNAPRRSALFILTYQNDSFSPEHQSYEGIGEHVAGRSPNLAVE